VKQLKFSRKASEKLKRKKKKGGAKKRNVIRPRLFARK
jgi:hypothetical protein